MKKISLKELNKIISKSLDMNFDIRKTSIFSKFKFELSMKDDLKLKINKITLKNDLELINIHNDENPIVIQEFTQHESMSLKKIDKLFLEIENLADQTVCSIKDTARSIGILGTIFDKNICTSLESIKAVELDLVHTFSE